MEQRQTLLHQNQHKLLETLGAVGPKPVHGHALNRLEPIVAFWTLRASLSITPAAVECSPCCACSLLLHFMLRASLLKLSLYLSISVGDRKDLSSCKRRRRHCWRVFIVSILLCEAKTISLVIVSVNFLLER